MKPILFTLIASVIMFSSCYSQLVKTKNDIMLIEQNKETFLNKPLQVLLNEIKPEIKLFFAEKGNPGGQLGYISFYFVDYDTFLSYKGKNKKLKRVNVTLDGKVVSNNDSLPVNKRFLWTDYYREGNKDLIVRHIIISEGVE